MKTHLAPRLSLMLGLLFLSWSGDLFAELLPETSVEQFWDKMPETPDDWQKEGLVAGYNNPNAKSVRPLMITEDRAAAFVKGFKQGQNAYKTLEADFKRRLEIPSIQEGSLGGRPLEEIEREYREQLEAIFHKHMPHIEVEETARMPIIVPGPGVR